MIDALTALTVLAVIVFVETFVVADTLPVTLIFAEKVVFELKVEAALTITELVFTVIILAVEFPRIAKLVPEVTTIAGPLVFPVLKVKSVVPFAVLIVVVVSEDIR